jgi:hypothetical protein
MLKCTPYIKNICQNINATLFATEGTADSGGGGSVPNSPRHSLSGGSIPNSPRHGRTAAEPQRQTEVRLTDLKTVKVDLIKAEMGLFGPVNLTVIFCGGDKRLKKYNFTAI